MAERTFSIANTPQYAYNSTTAPAKVATGTARKTMLQIQASPLGPPLHIIEWGVSFDDNALSTPGLVELVDTGNQGASGANWTAARMPYSTLATAISAATTTSFVLATGGGALFVPVFGGTAQTISSALALVAPNIGVGGGTGAEGMLTGQSELVVITARSTDTLTVVRNVDGRAGATSGQGLASIPIGSPIVGVSGQFQADIVNDNDQSPYPPSSVMWQNCGWNNGSGANGTDFGNVTETRYLAPPVLIEPIGTPGPIQLPLGREPELEPGSYARIVMTMAVAANAFCWIKWAE
jgi:hypothetical protein